MQEIRAFGETQDLCEVYSVGFQLAFASEDFQQCHSWVLCKDFLTDVLWATHNTDEVDIYGFKYNPAEHPLISMDPVRILIRNKETYSNDFRRQMQHTVRFINLVEKKLGFKPAVAEEVKHATGGTVYMFTLDKRWIHAPPMISMLGLYLRVGCYTGGSSTIDNALRYFKDTAREHEERMHDNWDDDGYDSMEDVMANDLQYVTGSRALRQAIMKRGLGIFKPMPEENYPDHTDTYTVHEQWGIVEAKNYEPFLTLWDLSGLDVIPAKVDSNTKLGLHQVATIKVSKS